MAHRAGHRTQREAGARRWLTRTIGRSTAARVGELAADVAAGAGTACLTASAVFPTTESEIDGFACARVGEVGIRRDNQTFTL